MLANGCRARIVRTRITLEQQISTCYQLSCLHHTIYVNSRSPASTALNLHPSFVTGKMAKRKSYSAVAHEKALTTILIPGPFDDIKQPPAKRHASQRKVSQPNSAPVTTNPEENADVLDGPEALRASPDADEPGESVDVAKAGMDAYHQVKEECDLGPSLENGVGSAPPLSKMSDIDSPAKKYKTNGVQVQSKAKKPAVDTRVKTTPKEPQFLDPEAEGEEEADEEEIQAALSRPPPVNSDYLPLPWKGRLGYVSSRSWEAEVILAHMD